MRTPTRSCCCFLICRAAAPWTSSSVAPRGDRARRGPARRLPRRLLERRVARRQRLAEGPVRSALSRCDRHVIRPVVGSRARGVRRRAHARRSSSSVTASPSCLPSMVTRLSEPPFTLSHGDYRADNFFFGGDGDLVVCDWQLVDRSRGARDLAYVLSQSVTPELRAQLDRPLVDRYSGTSRVAWGHRLQPSTRCGTTTGSRLRSRSPTQWSRAGASTSRTTGRQPSRGGCSAAASQPIEAVGALDVV